MAMYAELKSIICELQMTVKLLSDSKNEIDCRIVAIENKLDSLSDSNIKCPTENVNKCVKQGVTKDSARNQNPQPENLLTKSVNPIRKVRTSQKTNYKLRHTQSDVKILVLLPQLELVNQIVNNQYVKPYHKLSTQFQSLRPHLVRPNLLMSETTVQAPGYYPLLKQQLKQALGKLYPRQNQDDRGMPVILDL